MRLGQLPRGFAGLLLNQVAVHDLTAEAILHSSRDLAFQALLADPVVLLKAIGGAQRQPLLLAVHCAMPRR